MRSTYEVEYNDGIRSVSSNHVMSGANCDNSYLD